MNEALGTYRSRRPGCESSHEWTPHRWRSCMRKSQGTYNWIGPTITLYSTTFNQQEPPLSARDQPALSTNLILVGASKCAPLTECDVCLGILDCTAALLSVSWFICRCLRFFLVLFHPRYRHLFGVLPSLHPSADNNLRTWHGFVHQPYRSRNARTGRNIAPLFLLQLRRASTRSFCNRLNDACDVIDQKSYAF